MQSRKESKYIKYRLILYPLYTCTITCILLCKCAQYSVFTHNVFPQMGAQQGVAWGPSPGSEMLIMNINKSYTHTAHTHIPTLITAVSVLQSRNFMETSFSTPLFSIWIHKEVRHYYSPWSAVGPPGCVFIILCCKSISIICYPPSSLHFLFSLCLSPLLSLFFSRLLFDSTQF